MHGQRHHRARRSDRDALAEGIPAVAQAPGQAAAGQGDDPRDDRETGQARFSEQLQRVVLGVGRAHVAVAAFEGRERVGVGAEAGAETGMRGEEA